MGAQSSPAKLRRPSPLQFDTRPVTAPLSTGASDGEAYRLSRIQAEGWNAAHRIDANTLDRFDATKIEYLNPYTADPERTRWSAGFTSALAC